MRRCFAIMLVMGAGWIFTSPAVAGRIPFTGEVDTVRRSLELKLEAPVTSDPVVLRFQEGLEGMIDTLVWLKQLPTPLGEVSAPIRGELKAGPGPGVTFKAIDQSLKIGTAWFRGWNGEFVLSDQLLSWKVAMGRQTGQGRLLWHSTSRWEMTFDLNNCRLHRLAELFPEKDRLPASGYVSGNLQMEGSFLGRNAGDLAFDGSLVFDNGLIEDFAFREATLDLAGTYPFLEISGKIGSNNGGMMAAEGIFDMTRSGRWREQLQKFEKTVVAEDVLAVTGDRERLPSRDRAVRAAAGGWKDQAAVEPPEVAGADLSGSDNAP